MEQSALDRAVARATGESVSTIKRLGFFLIDSGDGLTPEAEEPGPQVIDWDELNALRHANNERRPLDARIAG
ncbi:hypothetical protein Pan216_41310 [Planctomycetes bacterium Pan216]|uniref:Uncharacterized protein n=1 Tax=Kolteria novifilia TaxID=2527975 RepID=A0A518B5Z5_9BACT|nr:hypothetical protein Pan216_32650 [Planctomycetes bacterium Pan216]QDU63253.1 hypothetical protein Pan216_41310 [Planctomycetes bacterium Pan216]